MRGKKILLIIAALLVAVALALVTAPIILVATPVATDMSPPTAIAVAGIVLGALVLICLVTGYYMKRSPSLVLWRRQWRHPKGAPMIVSMAATVFVFISGVFRMVMATLHTTNTANDYLSAIGWKKEKTKGRVRDHAFIAALRSFFASNGHAQRPSFDTG